MLFRGTNLISGSKLYHSTCIDRYGHNCLQIKIVHRYKLLTVLNKKDNQIIILNILNKIITYKQNYGLWNTFSLLMNFSTLIIPEENC